MLAGSTVERAVTATAIVRQNRSGARFVASLRIDIGATTMERTFDASTCEPLANATALVVAMAADPMLLSGEPKDAREAPKTLRPAKRPPPPPPPPPPPSRRVVATPAVSPRSPAPPSRAPERSPRVVPTLRTYGTVGTGTVPTIDGSLAMLAGIRVSSVRIEVGAAHVFRQTEPHPDISSVGVSVWVWSGLLRICPTPAFRAFEFPLCLGSDLGAMSAEGVGVADPYRLHQFWAALSGGPNLAWRPIPRFALWAGIEAFIALTRPGFTLANEPELYRTPPGGVRALFGLEVRLR